MHFEDSSISKCPFPFYYRHCKCRMYSSEILYLYVSLYVYTKAYI